jgi:hypothetical protein
MQSVSTVKRDPRKVRIYGLLIIFSLALLAFGYELEQWGVHKLFVHFANELGIAGLVGFFLAITIERLSQEEFRKLAEEERAEIKRDVFYYVYGHEIPLSIRDEIDAHILKVPYVRRRVVMQYELEPVQDDKTKEWYVLTTFTMNYDLENLTTDEMKFPFLAAVDKSPSKQFTAKFLKLSVQGCKVPFNWEGAELAKQQTEKENEIELRLPDKIVLLPKPAVEEDSEKVAPPNLTHITLQTQSVRFLRGHIDFLFTSHVCDLNLSVWADRSLKVSADTSEQNPLDPVKELPQEISWLTDRLKKSGELYYWKLKKPLLAYQTLQISWTAPGIPLGNESVVAIEEAKPAQAPAPIIV